VYFLQTAELSPPYLVESGNYALINFASNSAVLRFGQSLALGRVAARAVTTQT
jgi:hypothetical protein